MASLLQLFLQGVEHFGAHADGVADVVRADRHDHEFLNVDGVVSMFAAVDDVHHRHRQNAGRGAADIAEQGLAGEFGGRLGHGQGHAENGIGPKARFVRRAVHFNHGAVDADLFGGVIADEFLGNLAIHSGDCFEHAFAHKTRLVAVALLIRLMRAGGGARRHRGAAHGTAFKIDVDLNRRVAPAVEDLAGVDVDDRAHGALLGAAKLLRLLHGQNRHGKSLRCGEGGFSFAPPARASARG